MTSQRQGTEINITYDDKLARYFLLATLLWGVVGMLVGALAALQLAFWPSNLNTSWLTFGRMRPLHTNAVIFAFSANGFFAGMYYSMQRLLKTRMWSDTLSWIHFWGWQLIIVAAAITIPLGLTQGKEYAELEWPIDIAIALVWVLMTINVLMTLKIRRVEHIYVALWFYLGSILTIAMLHVVNSLAIPVSLSKSYSVFAGVQDALVQWWYGHNAVGFLLTTPFLGMMYYFLPKASGRPVFSYRLSIIHFWSLVFIYIWTGPHHLLYSSLPEWAQSLGMVFSLMLIAPSWGGMLNGLLTLNGAWHKVRVDPILKFFVVALTFYGMATLEGPIMSIKSVNLMTHYTDYTIAHVHGGALGWLGGMIFGMTYWLVPRLFGREIYSKSMVNLHFWLFIVGLILYVTSMYVAGITQGLMWLSTGPDGLLTYPQFIESIVASKSLYWIRLIGGTIYLIGMVLCFYNVLKTAMGAKATDETVRFVPERHVLQPKTFHEKLEHNGFAFNILIAIAIIIGGIVEFVPVFMIKSNVPTMAEVKPYSPLELQGRDVYIKEGCYNCHSQMIRPVREETIRYGEFTRGGESVYDHPFQFGSKRTGPDLQRLGGKYPDFWHYRHMLNPRDTSPGSIMPNYPWLAVNKVDVSSVKKKLEVMTSLGVPYSKDEVESAAETYMSQARKISEGLTSEKVMLDPEVELTALIAYMQRLGVDGKVAIKNQSSASGTSSAKVGEGKL
jgi:cytochrome c oxidase cbb3-type subunit I/II